MSNENFEKVKLDNLCIFKEEKQNMICNNDDINNCEKVVNTDVKNINTEVFKKESEGQKYVELLKQIKEENEIDDIKYSFININNNSNKCRNSKEDSLYIKKKQHEYNYGNNKNIYEMLGEEINGLLNVYSSREHNNNEYNNNEYNNSNYNNRKYNNRKYSNRKYNNRKYNNRKYNNRKYNAYANYSDYENSDKIEHYNIMSSTENVMSSSNSITEMYESNYNLFVVNNSDNMSEISTPSFNSQENLPLSYCSNKQKKMLVKNNKKIKNCVRHCENELLNPITKNKKSNILDNCISLKESKKKESFFPYYINYNNFEKRENKKCTEKKIMNFNPLTYITNTNNNPNMNNFYYDYYDNLKKYNNFFYNYNYCNNCNAELQNNSFTTSHNTYARQLKEYNKMENELHDLKSHYSLECEKLFKKTFLTKQSCNLKTNVKKQFNNNYNFPVFTKCKSKKHEGSKKMNTNFFILKRKKNNMLYDIDNFYKFKNVKFDKCLNNNVQYKPYKNVMYCKKINSTSKGKYLVKKGKFMRLVKNLKLLGYVLLLGFFFSKTDKTLKET
ncbi:conserved protein, unknown function [Hepatocystis sp. ex Piliocolobus tephrosceles]|nr:conserved protein, unknown function [Hepatocystis sp. ex Piliocolobus tephrosceles]